LFKFHLAEVDILLTYRIEDQKKVSMIWKKGKRADNDDDDCIWSSSWRKRGNDNDFNFFLT
jgi:hypothetical protein